MLNNEREFGQKITCFASSAALQLEATKRHNDGTAVAETVSIELCPVVAQKANWKAKLSIQLSQDELPIYAAVLLGYLPKAEFKRHEKGLYIARQKSKIYYRGSAGVGNLFQLPVPIGKSFAMSQLVLKQLSADLEGACADFVLAGIKGSSALYQIQ